MISDILSDAFTDIQHYIDSSVLYEDWKTSDNSLCKQRVYQALEAMEVARICLDNTIDKGE